MPAYQILADLKEYNYDLFIQSSNLGFKKFQLLLLNPGFDPDLTSFPLSNPE